MRPSGLRALPDADFDSLYTGCDLHPYTQRRHDPMIAACFVADRLDLSRVGRRAEPRLMPAPRNVIDMELINAAIDRQRKPLG